MGEDRDRLVELDIDNVAHGGITVARLDGRVVFVADAIPGEKVLARVVDDGKASYWRADTVEVLEASPDRVPHVWAEAGIERDPAERPGGAEFGHIALPRQRALKSEVLTDALRRFGGIDRAVEVEAIEGAADGTRWRTRLRLHAAPGGRVGPYAARSHSVVDVSAHPLATAALEQAALDLRVSDAAAVELVQTSGGEVRVQRLAEERSKTGSDGGRGSARGRGQTGRRDAVRGGARGRAGQGAPNAGAPGTGAAKAEKPATIVERVGEREFRLAENGFWQVHHGAAQALTTAVQELTRPDLFDPRAANLDLYGGVGLLAAALGDRFGPATRITSVESDEAATDHAAANLSEWLGARAVTARVEPYLRSLHRDASAEDRRRHAAATMLIDPPRSGAGKEVVDALAAVGPAQIVYVACDPVAFARDAGLFAERGYELDAVRAYDLFPHTHHVETVGVLVRSES